MRNFTAVSVLCAFALTASPSNAAPLVSGNFSIAQKLLHGDGHVLIVGDSLQNSLVNLYPSYWNPDHQAGQVFYDGNPNLYSQVLQSPLVTSSSNFYYPPGSPFYSSPPPDGFTNAAPMVAGYVQFTGNAGQPIGTNPVFINRAFENDLQATSPVKANAASQINVSVLTLANPNGVKPGSLNLEVRSDSDYAIASSTPISTYSATTQYQTTSFAVPLSAWTSTSRPLAIQYSVAPGASPDPGSNLIVAAARFTTGDPGFQLADIHMGSESIDYFLDPATCSDAALAAYLNFTDTNIAYIWLGQNGSGTTTGPQFELKMQQLIARYKAAKPGMQFVLVSTYDTGGPNLAQYPDALNDIAQHDPSVLFLNLYQAAGSFGTIDQPYLLDHVHENQAGSAYMGGLTSQLLTQAAAQVPEPSLGFVALLLPLTLGRKLRRR